MKYALLGALSYGLQGFTVIMSQALFYLFSEALGQSTSPGFSSTNLDIIQELNWISDLLGLAALGGIALTWLLMGYHKASRLFLIAGLGILISIVDGNILQGLFRGEALQLSAMAAFGLISVITVLALFSAAKMFRVPYMKYAGALLTVSLIERVGYSIALYLGVTGNPTQPNNSALANSVGGLFVEPLFFILRILPILIPILALLGFISLKRSITSQRGQLTKTEFT